MSDKPASDTPMTDAALERFPEECAFAIFPLMRQLERELAAALAAALAENERLRQRADQAEQSLALARAALKPFADDWMIADEAGELQHWPKEEVARCKAAYDAINDAQEKP